MSYQSKFTVEEVLQMIRNWIESEGSMRALASKWKVSPMYLSDILRGRRLPGNKVLKRLNIEVNATTSREYTLRGAK